LNALTIDFLTGEGRPDDLLRDPISELPRWYTKMFWDLVAPLWIGSLTGAIRVATPVEAVAANHEEQRVGLGSDTRQDSRR